MILSGFTGLETAERPEKCIVEALQLLAICSQVLHNAKLFQEVAHQQTIHPYCLNSHSNTSSLSQSDDIGLWEMHNFRQQSILLQALGSSHHSGHGMQCMGSHSFPEKKIEWICFLESVKDLKFIQNNPQRRKQPISAINDPFRHLSVPN